MIAARPRRKKDIFQMNKSKAVSFVSASAVPYVSLMRNKVGKTTNNNNNKDNNNTKKQIISDQQKS